MDFSYCFIDTPPALTEQNRQVLRLSDLVLIPTRPSPNDLWSLGATLDLVKQAGTPFVFVLTQAKGNARITVQTQRRRPHLRIGRLPAEKLPGKRVHASAGFPGPHGSEDRHAGIQATLRDGEPCGVENLPRFDRVMDFPNYDSRSLLVRRKRRNRVRETQNQTFQIDMTKRPASMTVTNGAV